MRVLSLTFALLVVAVATPSAPAADDGGTFERPPLAAALDSCAASALPAERVAVFTGSMPAIASSNRMAMRFDLERLRPGDKRFRRVIAPSFGVWERSQHRTAACQQPDLRPDLVPEAVTAIVDAPGLALYRVKVRNTGRATAGPFTVRVGGGSVEVRQLVAGKRTTVLVLAPACAFGERLFVRVDADGRVDEADERGNLLRGICPVLSG